MLIPTDLPGVEFRPLINMGGEHGFNESFFEDVHVPVKNRIGEENRGWYVGATALDFERSGIAGSATVRRDVRELADYLGSDEGREVRGGEFRGLRRESRTWRSPPTCTQPLPADASMRMRARPQLRGVDGSFGTD